MENARLPSIHKIIHNSSLIQLYEMEGEKGKIKEILGNLNLNSGFLKCMVYHLGIKPQYPCLPTRKMLSKSAVR